MCFCVWIDVSTILFHYVVYALGSLDGTKQGCENTLWDEVRADVTAVVTTIGFQSILATSSAFTSIRCTDIYIILKITQTVGDTSLK